MEDRREEGGLTHSIETLEALRQEMRRIVVGQEEVIEDVLVCLLVGGHALVEGVPGLGKTTMIRMLADMLDLQFSRIQCTPDLMPADIIGTNILMPGVEGGTEISFRRGPLFTNLLLADEINRATPKTQSALLEAMQEGRVTVGGSAFALPSPFAVMATQNPIEMEGTYPLPEAQLDRFFYKLRVEAPGEAEMLEILHRTTGPSAARAESVCGAEELAAARAVVLQIPYADEVARYAVRLVSATHGRNGNTGAERYIRYGASPRAAQAMLTGGKVYALLDGRSHLAYQDIRRAALPSLRHRLIMSFRAEAEGVTPEQMIGEILSATPELA
jgi:MoxR-like ATPase